MNKPQILFVEDDIAVGNLIATTLETQNYQYHRAKNGQQAVIDALSYRPDVMLLDLGLPDIDGIDIIKKIRSWSNLPIIVVSARSDDRDKVAALDAGADDYLTKPFSVDELLARLRVAVRQSEGQRGGRPLPERRPCHRLCRGLRLPGRGGIAFNAHRIQAPVPAGQEYRQGSDPQLYHQRDLGRLL